MFFFCLVGNWYVVMAPRSLEFDLLTSASTPASVFWLFMPCCCSVSGRWCPIFFSVFVFPRFDPLMAAWVLGASPLSPKHMLPLRMRWLLPLSLLLLVPHSLMRPLSVVLPRLRGGLFPSLPIPPLCWQLLPPLRAAFVVPFALSSPIVLAAPPPLLVVGVVLPGAL